jgi:hypothetical protein
MADRAKKRVSDKTVKYIINELYNKREEVVVSYIKELTPIQLSKLEQLLLNYVELLNRDKEKAISTIQLRLDQLLLDYEEMLNRNNQKAISLIRDRKLEILLEWNNI